MERNLHLTERKWAFIENASADIAQEFDLVFEDVRSRILGYIAPYPPLQQCKDAIVKVRIECTQTLQPKKRND